MQKNEKNLFHCHDTMNIHHSFAFTTFYQKFTKSNDIHTDNDIIVIKIMFCKE